MILAVLHDLTIDDLWMEIEIGASGVLGRAVANHFHEKGTTAHLLSFSRKSPSSLYPNLPSPTPLDLLDESAVRQYFTSLQSDPERKIDFLIHCAAERRPDVAEADPERATKLNEGSTKLLATLATELGFGLIYLSTDYVFDGKKPPYEVNDTPNPLNLYGKLKRAGEEAVLSTRQEAGGDKPLTVLRIPLLYGQVEYNAETAVNIFVDILEDQSGKEYTMDHFAVRFPTCVEDVARVIYDFIHLDQSPLPPIIHYSTSKGMTKYQQLEIIAKYMGVPYSHVKPDAQDPATKPNPSGVQRPGNTQLSVAELQKIGVDVADKPSGGFENWWKTWAEKRKTA